MFKKILATAVITTLPLTSFANELIAGGDLTDLGGLTAVVGSVGWAIDLENLENQRVVVGGRFGIGIGDDNGWELDSMIGAFAKYQYDFGNNWYVQGIAAYTRFETSYEYNDFFGDFSGSVSDSELSIGGGGGYKLSERSAVEVNLEMFDIDDALSIGYRYSF